jgi:hypothetical protein
MKNLLALLVLLSGCVSYKPAKQVEITKTFVIQKDFDKTWTELVRYFAENNITFRSMDKASGLIATDVKQFDPFNNGGLIDCGQLSGPSMTTEKGFAIYNVFAEKEKNYTKITINVKPYMTTYAQNGSTMDRDCYSTGKTESKIYEFVKK